MELFLKVFVYNYREGIWIGMTPEVYLGGCHDKDLKKVIKETDVIYKECMAEYKKSGHKPVNSYKHLIRSIESAMK